MNELVVLLIVGVLLTLGFLAALLKGPRATASESEPCGELFDIVSLPGLSFRWARQLFESADYDLLRASPRLEGVAQQFWQERRRLVLHWLRLLEDDVRSLWRFRRMLTSYGISRGLAEEAGIAAKALGTLVMLGFLRLVVTLTGPFALVVVLRFVVTRVKEIRLSCEDLWHAAPPHLVTRLRQEWADQFILQ